MTNLDPRILNHMRRNELNKDPMRNTIPAQQTPETEELIEDEPTPTTALGRLATRLNLMGEAREA